MAWKETSVEALAKSLGANVAEVREKQRLVKVIVKARKDKELSQAALAKKLGISQARVAQIESGVARQRSRSTCSSICWWRWGWTIRW